MIDTKPSGKEKDKLNQRAKTRNKGKMENTKCRNHTEEAYKITTFQLFWLHVVYFEK